MSDVTPSPLRKAVRGPAAMTALLAGVVAVSVAGAPAQASAPHQGRVPMHQCWVNGVPAPAGDQVDGTPRGDDILCDSDLNGVTVSGGGGDDTIEVRGLVIDSAVTGGEGDDTIRTKHLVPQTTFSMVRGNRGNDVIRVASVRGDGARLGAIVHGDDGDDRITTGSVSGAPGTFNRGGGIVTGNDGVDTIRTGIIDFSGRVLGGSENDTIEAQALGPESGGLIQAGPGDDRISGPGGATLVVGEHWGTVDAGVGKDTCLVKSVSTRTSISSCETLPAAAGESTSKPDAPAGGRPTGPGSQPDAPAGGRPSGSASQPDAPAGGRPTGPASQPDAPSRPVAPANQKPTQP
ncbi:hypothetical protein [Streptomyces sp. NPDC008121]|uniref:hypothetical protein n=1 Tax=Streptomyces sp. NPDC008121 TaxID=3364809 RepID=UPI0036F02F4E